MTAATPASQNEQWQRLNNDPLLMVRGPSMGLGQGGSTLLLEGAWSVNAVQIEHVLME